MGNALLSYGIIDFIKLGSRNNNGVSVFYYL